ncbi:ABC transporter permease [Vibrio sp. JC009]|uniref:ABC transporter permease n=1 Tax=Vibrio sp. JC009 TaxID=2912314 RepID=UPI0023B159F6|nr:ABC transporter permease [Vibrio sp. JC009]WED20743.1 ABC transporter permease [Vibrio sp. JC009]
MQSAIDISWLNLGLFSLTLLIPFAINSYYRLEMTKEFAVSLSRMAVQLSLVGLYLEVVFSLNNAALNIFWIAVMTMVGSSAIIGKTNLPKKALFVPVTAGLFVGLAPLLLILFSAVIKPSPVYNAQYLIPVAGMLLGNSLSGNIVALQNLFSAFNERRSEYEAALSLGASPQYACTSFVRDAIKKSLAPIMASMATTGIVTLPGMMTGQILGGASPMVAIKYQMVILIAIFVMMSISVAVSLQLSLKRAITKEGKIVVNFLEK